MLVSEPADMVVCVPEVVDEAAVRVVVLVCPTVTGVVDTAVV